LEYQRNDYHLIHHLWQLIRDLLDLNQDRLVIRKLNLVQQYHFLEVILEKVEMQILIHHYQL
jgi:hypothetical protein